MSVFDYELIKIIHIESKTECLESMAKMFVDKGFINDYTHFISLIEKREETMSTGMGRNIGLPHARSSSITELKCAVYILDNMINFDSLDEEGVDLVFMFAIPEKNKKEYMKALGAVSGFMAVTKNRERLRLCKTIDAVFDLLKEVKI